MELEVKKLAIYYQTQVYYKVKQNLQTRYTASQLIYGMYLGWLYTFRFFIAVFLKQKPDMGHK